MPGEPGKRISSSSQKGPTRWSHVPCMTPTLNSPHASPGWDTCQAGLPSKESSASAGQATQSQQCLLRANCAPLTFGICSSTLGFLAFSCSRSHASDKDLTHEGMRLMCMTPSASLTRSSFASNDCSVISGFGRFPCTSSGSYDFSRNISPNPSSCFCQRLLQTFHHRQLFGNALRCCGWDKGCQLHWQRTLGFAACGWGGDTPTCAASPYLVASQVTSCGFAAQQRMSHEPCHLQSEHRLRDDALQSDLPQKVPSPQDSPTA